ncbi:SAM-dependent methyltransferase [Hasllibacter halocynthiae]|uniref:SAM-dependent methyltransferase n=1 Tax=Hasllibacter halocynthiae TaxID=595589 RepID=A0A2T0X958_9RHOB|nr:class I SAM-dependent rRNA methyltransferase [Hasllibacter halocynthiae]PRY95482.1 SAM-dependent methyltransferase [Hasllibacter halocynthiae]
MDRPVIRLRPKADVARIRRGAPFLGPQDLVLDRRARSLAPGTIATLEDATRAPLATVAVAPEARLAARVLDRDPAATVDDAWIARRIERAAALRARLFERPFFRLVHAEGDALPGLIVDRFGDAAAIQPNAAWIDGRLGAVIAALEGLGVERVVVNGTARARAAEGLPDRLEVVRGRVDGPVEVPMNGAVYLADLVGGQKTGLFYDQRENHRFAAAVAGPEVLDAFSHVGGFGLAMLAGGAERATLVDASAAALALAEGGAARMGRTVETIRSDAFDALAALRSEGRAFDTVICDPPAFAPSKAAREAGLRAYERIAFLAAPLVRPGGVLGLCSCSHAADLEAFRAASLRGVGKARRAAAILRTGFAGPDHPVHPMLSGTGYLKALFLRLA